MRFSEDLYLSLSKGEPDLPLAMAKVQERTRRQIVAYKQMSGIQPFKEFLSILRFPKPPGKRPSRVTKDRSVRKTHVFQPSKSLVSREEESITCRRL
jgi:hypothetical protein